MKRTLSTSDLPYEGNNFELEPLPRISLAVSPKKGLPRPVFSPKKQCLDAENVPQDMGLETQHDRAAYEALRFRNLKMVAAVGPADVEGNPTILWD